MATFPKPSGPWLAIQHDLDKFGIKPQLMFMKSYNLMLSSLLNKQIDVATFTHYIIAKIPGKLKKVHSSTISKYLYNSCGWWFKEDFIKANPEAIKRFVNALTMGRQFIKDNKKAAVQMLAKYSKMNTADFKEELQLPRFDMPVTIYEYGLKRTNEILKKYKLIGKTLDTKTMVDPRFARVISEEY